MFTSLNLYNYFEVLYSVKLIIRLFLLLFFVGSGAKVMTITISELVASGVSMLVIGLCGTAYVASVFVSGLFLAKILKRYSIYRVILLGGVLMAAGYGCLSLSMTSPIYLFAGMVMIGVAATFAGYSPASILIRQNFSSNGLITSAVFCGSAIGAAFYSALYGWGVGKFGFGSTLRIFCLIQITAAVVLFLKKNAPDSTKQEDSTHEPADKSEILQSRNTYLKSGVFWYIFAFAILTSGTVSTIHSYLPSYLVEAQYSLSTSASIYSAMMLAAAPATLLSGYLTEKYSVSLFINTNIGALTIGMVLLLLCPTSVQLIWIAGILLGIACPISTLAAPLLLGDVFDNCTYTQCIGIVNASTFVSLGLMFCATAVMSEIFGSQLPAFRILMFLSVLLLIMGAAWRYIKYQIKPEGEKKPWN